MEYAIVDIETTGGAASNSGITEIAIVLHNGKEIIGRYETLLNPEKRVPAYISALTGITTSMVAHCPKFEEAAEKIFNLLQGKIFIAHNVNFDYSFIKYHLANAGYNFSARKLCTVRMSRKIVKGLHSYSLGNLCRELDIPISQRHRAGGDVDATVILFEKLLAWDNENNIEAMLKNQLQESQLPSHLSIVFIEKLPQTAGVYYFKNQQEKIIYVGKAKNIYKRVKSHFTGHNPHPQRQNFLHEIYSIHYEECGTELMAFILEAIEIKKLYPKYNHALKKYEPKFGLFMYEALDGIMRMGIGRFNKNKMPIEVFTSAMDGNNLLHTWIKKYNLCKRFCNLGSCENCDAGCVSGDNDIKNYNLKTHNIIDSYLLQLPSYFIIDKGRNKHELSIIWIEKGKFYGMGYVNIYADLDDELIIKQQLKRYSSNHYIMHLIKNFMSKNIHQTKTLYQQTIDNDLIFVNQQ